MKPPLEKIAEDDGLSIDATFSLAGHSPISVTLERGGGGRNLHYSRGLHLLLQRLSQAQATLLRAALTSSRVTGHQEEGIELELEDYSYPIDIASIQVEELRRALQRALARTGRTPDRDGPGGNPTKRITLDVRFPTILDYDVATFLRTGKTARQKFIPRLAIGSTMNSQYLHLLSSLDQSGSRGMADYLGRLIASLVSKRFVILSGLSGSGKTQLARLIAGWMGGLNSLARVDPFAPNSTIQGQSITYLVKNSDALSIEVWNSPDESDAVRVLLPRSLIREWADCIVEKSFDRDVSSSDIRSAVQQESRWSGQLHSFHAPLKAAAFALLEAESGYGPPTALLVPVGADWTGNENLLGYPDGIDAQVYRSTPILDFVLRACDDPDRPYFLILDEMNLSHVERYFADFLSAMESGEGMIPLYQGQDRKADRDIPQTLHLPRNLFVIGTVNVDETTYMFSPKVLDRANVLEFRVDEEEMAGFLGSPQKPDLNAIAGLGKEFGPEFVRLANDHEIRVPGEWAERFQADMTALFKIFARHHWEFGYRTAYEASRFAHFWHLLHGSDDDSYSNALDAVIVQKLMPKLHGSRAKLRPLLQDLWGACLAGAQVGVPGDPSRAIDSALYPLSADKVRRMWELLHDHGFASFAEA